MRQLYNRRQELWCFKAILLEMQPNSGGLFAVTDSAIIWGKCTLRTNSELRTLVLAQYLSDSRTWTTPPAQAIKWGLQTQSSPEAWWQRETSQGTWRANTQSTKPITPQVEMDNHLQSNTAKPSKVRDAHPCSPATPLQKSPSQEKWKGCRLPESIHASEWNVLKAFWVRNLPHLFL